MGKGGDASAPSRVGLELSDKPQKYTWAEVKKHVSGRYWPDMFPFTAELNNFYEIHPRFPF